MEQADHTALPSDAILEPVTRCVKELALVLADPTQYLDMDTFASSVREATGAEAVAVFTLDEGGSVLRPAGRVGYTNFYRNYKYLVENKTALTTYVYRNREALNLSRAQLEAPGFKVPVSGLCEQYVRSGRFFNIIAVPILYGYTAASAKCIGVLKAENQGQNPNASFRPESFAIVRILAEVIAIALEQRRIAELWNTAEKAWLEHSHKGLNSYRDTVAELLRKLFDAEAVALYRRTMNTGGSESFRHDASNGFRRGRAARGDHHQVISAENHCVLSQTAVRQINRRWDASQVQSLAKSDQFVQECEEALGNPVRSLLIFSIHNNRELLGVVAVINKLGETTTFDPLDEQICGAFASRYVVPYLEVSGKAAGPAEPDDYEKLVQHFGAYEGLKGIHLLRRVLEIEEYRQAQQPHLLAEACARYFGFTTRQNYLGKVKQARKTLNAPEGD